MKLRVGAVILAGALFGAAALVPVASEGRGGNDGGRGRCGQTQSQCRQLSANCPQDRQRLRDGSCGNANCPQQVAKRDCPGPADCGQGAGTQGDSGSGTSSGTK